MKWPWKYISVSFVIGLLLGAAAGLLCSRPLSSHWMRHSPERFLRRLDQKLHLTESQKGEIHSLLMENHKKVMAYQDQMRQTVRAGIRAVLTPAQQPEFDAMVARYDAKRREKEERE